MPAYKNQHFLPQQALRKFGYPDGRSISLLHIASSKHVPKASIGDQCSRPYFYVKGDHFEGPLKEVEDRGFAIINRIIKGEGPPTRDTEDHRDLVRYLSLQQGRTYGQAKIVQETGEVFAKRVLEEALIAKGDPEGLLPYLSELKVSFEGATLDNVYQSTISSPLLMDLSMEVITAAATQDFLLGDDPVILTNKYFLGRGENPNSGLASRGLIVFLPLSPNNLLLLYDSEAYRFRKVPTSHEEVVECNMLQLSCAQSCAYYRTKDLVADSCAKASTFSRVDDMQFHHVAEDGRRAIIIEHQKPSVRLGPALLKRFVIRGTAKLHRFRVGNSEVRNPELAEMIRDFGANPASFKAFMREIGGK